LAGSAGGGKAGGAGVPIPVTKDQLEAATAAAAAAAASARITAAAAAAFLCVSVGALADGLPRSSAHLPSSAGLEDRWRSSRRLLGASWSNLLLVTSNDTELEKLKKRLQFVMYCIDRFVSRKKNRSLTLWDLKSSIPDSRFVLSGARQWHPGIAGLSILASPLPKCFKS
jgi:hypothetical protein